MKRAFPQLLTLFLLGAVLAACGRKVPSDEIRIGGIFDLTGPTSEAGHAYAEGVRRYVQYVNGKGGINGRRVRLIDVDTGYIISRDLEAYRRLVEKEKVHLIIGWSTGATEKLVPSVARDRVPFTGVSFSRKLADVKTAPYNFLTCLTYSDQMRIALKYALSRWRDKTRKPRVAFLFNDKEYGRAPLPAGRDFAAKNGMEVVAEEVVSLDARDAVDQLRRVKAAGADFAVIQETTLPTSVILRDAAALKMKTQFIGLVWSCDEKLIALAGKSAEGFAGTTPQIYSDLSLPGVRRIMDFNRSRGISFEGVMLFYIHGWITAELMLEGVRRAGDDLSGPSLKRGLESIRDYDTGGITAPYSFSPDNHVGLDRLKMGQVKNGRWRSVTGFLTAH